MNHLIHDLDRDGWGSAALLLAQLTPMRCMLYPTHDKEVLPLKRRFELAPGDTIWVLDIPSPPNWDELDLPLDTQLNWVDHHLKTWITKWPDNVTVYLPKDAQATTTMSTLIINNLISVSNASAFASQICQSKSVWAAVFDGLSTEYPSLPLDLRSLAVELASAPMGRLPSETLLGLAKLAAEQNKMVQSLLDCSRIDVGDTWVVAHLENARRIPLSRLTISLGKRHPGKVIILAHRRSVIYCGRSSKKEKPDLYVYFESRGLKPKGHAYVSFVHVPTDTIDTEVKALCSFLQEHPHA